MCFGVNRGQSARLWPFLVFADCGHPAPPDSGSRGARRIIGGSLPENSFR
jgi:hypothetical protein